MKLQLLVPGICVVSLWLSFMVQADTAGFGFGAVPKKDIEELHVDEFGQDKSTIIANGYLFVDFKYIDAPYVIQRFGIGVAVNSMLVTCPILPSSNRVAEAKANWQDPLHGITQDSLGKTAEGNAIILRNALNSGSAVFLSGQRRRPIRLPVRGKLRESEFRTVLQVLAEQGPEDGKVTKLQELVKSGQLTYHVAHVFKTADDVKRFEQGSLQSTNFMARVTTLLAEGEKTSASRTEMVPEK